MFLWGFLVYLNTAQIASASARHAPPAIASCRRAGRLRGKPGRGAPHAVRAVLPARVRPGSTTAGGAAIQSAGKPEGAAPRGGCLAGATHKPKCVVPEATAGRCGGGSPAAAGVPSYAKRPSRPGIQLWLSAHSPLRQPQRRRSPQPSRRSGHGATHRQPEIVHSLSDCLS